ncbi:MAG: stage II sporulation protein D [Firmicutes bacterium]|nr:stage II sporulation protein D [Bacillota bacterium]
MAGWNVRRRRRGGELVSFALAAALLVLWLVFRYRSDEPVIGVWDAAAGRVVRMGLEEYVQGVVAAEMPAHFHPEALKAQAVAARTYAMRRIASGERLADRPAAHVTSDFRVHQAWTSRDAFLQRFGPAEGVRRWGRVAAAVKATRGMVLTYRGELIEALYHSTSGGHTEDASWYFEGGQPYLVGVPDPYGDHSPWHTSVARVPLAQLLARLFGGEAGRATGEDGMSAAGDGAAGTGSVVSGSGLRPGGAALPVRVLERTPSGRAAAVEVGGRTFSGRAVREALGLVSSWFDVAVEGDTVIFFLRGHGHGVGMPQYGADGMARAGAGFADILAYYYPGTTLERRY